MMFFNKIKWVAGILLVFLIVLVTNLIDKDNYNRLRYSVNTLFEDRVVASDLILEMTILIQEKEIALAVSDSLFFKTQNEGVNQKIQALIVRYEQTKLTNREQIIFNQLKEELNKLFDLETQYINSDNRNNVSLFKTIDDIVHSLYDLSKVQLEEGRRQMLLSNETMRTIDLFTQIEIIFLVCMAVLVQIIILYKPRSE